jgi:SAM-dependent methyltransferase
MSPIMVLRMPIRFKRFYAEFKGREFTLLDVGCGYDSSATTKRYFSQCKYHGIDRDTESIDEVNLRLMERFYPIDLDMGSLDALPDEFFDVVVFSHIIEHLHHGTRVLADLVRKLRPGGVIYIEYPGLGSFRTPHARGSGCSHFCDDPTHVRAYSMHEILNVLLDHNMTIIKAGTRRDRLRLALAPASFALGLVRGSPWNRHLWDVFGFAEYVYARRLGSRVAVAGDPASERAGREVVPAGSLSGSIETGGGI